MSCNVKCGVFMCNVCKLAQYGIKGAPVAAASMYHRVDVQEGGTF